MTAPRELHFFVSGKPVPKARPRVVGRGKRTFTPERTAFWEDRVRWTGRVSVLRAGWKLTTAPCHVELAVRGRAATADLDNVAKSVLDGLNGVVWDDDRRVVNLHVWDDRPEAPEGPPEGVLVVVRVVGPEACKPRTRSRKA